MAIHVDASSEAGSARQRPLASLLEHVLGGNLPVAISCYDGSRAGPSDADTTLVVRSPDAIRRIVTSPGELGFSRAYVAGDIDIDGDIYKVLGLRDHFQGSHLRPAQWLELARVVGTSGLHRLPPPAEEISLAGRRHTPRRDADAIAHHYDVSNEFYEMVLGPSMTYSCALWGPHADTLEEAQSAKHELVCRKLGLRPGMRLLDVGCGWGSMALHAARHHGVSVVGVTLSQQQAQWGRRAVAAAGMSGQVELRVQDYRHVSDAPFDAISSVGMFEHVGESKLSVYFSRLFDLLVPGGRLLNHAIAQPAGERARMSSKGFVHRYVFPDGELLEVGSVVSAMQSRGFEVRHLESIREHYPLTLRRWVANLESNWDAAVAEVGAGRARVWRLYMAGAALNFEEGRIQVHQTLGVRPDGGSSAMELRPDW